MDAALFRADGPATFVPTAAAVSAWDQRIVHGGAVAALLAGRLAPDEGTLARLAIELLAPVPMGPLVLDRSDAVGGHRVQRRDATLTHEGRSVVAARALVVRRAEPGLPERALDHPSPFDPAAAPTLGEPNRQARELVGHESFDSLSVAFRRMRVPGDRRIHQWIALVMPVVEGAVLRGVEIAAVAADYAQSGVYRQLPFETWSFRNADQTIHLAREPVGTWVGVRCDGLVQPSGAGFNAADLFDADGRVGHSAATVVVERRPS
jgi:hypothetical protein